MQPIRPINVSGNKWLLTSMEVTRSKRHVLRFPEKPLQKRTTKKNQLKERVNHLTFGPFNLLPKAHLLIANFMLQKNLIL